MAPAPHGFVFIRHQEQRWGAFDNGNFVSINCHGGPAGPSGGHGGSRFDRPRHSHPKPRPTIPSTATFQATTFNRLPIVGYHPPTTATIWKLRCRHQRGRPYTFNVTSRRPKQGASYCTIPARARTTNSAGLGPNHRVRRRRPLNVRYYGPRPPRPQPSTAYNQIQRRPTAILGAPTVQRKATPRVTSTVNNQNSQATRHTGTTGSAALTNPALNRAARSAGCKGVRGPEPARNHGTVNSGFRLGSFDLFLTRPDLLISSKLDQARRDPARHPSKPSRFRRGKMSPASSRPISRSKNGTSQQYLAKVAGQRTFTCDDYAHRQRRGSPPTSAPRAAPIRSGNANAHKPRGLFHANLDKAQSGASNPPVARDPPHEILTSIPDTPSPLPKTGSRASKRRKFPVARPNHANFQFPHRIGRDFTARTIRRSRGNGAVRRSVVIRSRYGQCPRGVAKTDALIRGK